MTDKPSDLSDPYYMSFPTGPSSGSEPCVKTYIETCVCGDGWMRMKDDENPGYPSFWIISPSISAHLSLSFSSDNSASAGHCRQFFGNRECSFMSSAIRNLLLFFLPPPPHIVFSHFLKCLRLIQVIDCHAAKRFYGVKHYRGWKVYSLLRSIFDLFTQLENPESTKNSDLFVCLGSLTTKNRMRSACSMFTNCPIYIHTLCAIYSTVWKMSNVLETVGAPSKNTITHIQ